MVPGGSAYRLGELDPRFIRRVLWTTAWFGGVAFICIAAYANLPKGLAWGAGVILGLANLFFLDGLIAEMLRPEGGRAGVLIAYVLLKFPAVYVVGAAALIRFRLDPVFVLAGFSTFLLVALLKVLGRLLLTSRWLARERKGAGGAFLRSSPGGKHGS